MENKETFHYTYSAKEQEEIKKIRNRYVAPIVQEDKMTQLRRLDQKATGKATTVSLVFGIIGALLLGSGMSLAMTELGAALGLSSTVGMVIGIVIGVIGIIFASCAYPIYNRVLRKEREKIAPEIIRLTDELMK